MLCIIITIKTSIIITDVSKSSFEKIFIILNLKYSLEILPFIRFEYKSPVLKSSKLLFIYLSDSFKNSDIPNFSFCSSIILLLL